jgi:hypothetical protein
VLALVYGLISLILVPFLLLGAMFGPHGGFDAIFVIFLPIVYAVVGFIGGVLSAFVYNIVAKWSGGVEYIATEAPQSVQQRSFFALCLFLAASWK